MGTHTRSAEAAEAGGKMSLRLGGAANAAAARGTQFSGKWPHYKKIKWRASLLLCSIARALSLFLPAAQWDEEGEMMIMGGKTKQGGFFLSGGNFKAVR